MRRVKGVSMETTKKEFSSLPCEGKSFVIGINYFGIRSNNVTSGAWMPRRNYRAGKAFQPSPTQKPQTWASYRPDDSLVLNTLIQKGLAWNSSHKS